MECDITEIVQSGPVGRALSAIAKRASFGSGDLPSRMFECFPGHDQTDDGKTPVPDPREMLVHLGERKRSSDIRNVGMVEEGGRVWCVRR